MAPNVNHVCKVLCNGLICVPSAPNSYVNVLNVDIFGRAIILLTTGLTRESQSTVLCLAVSWDCAPWLVHRKWSDGLDHRPETPREQESRLQTIGLCAGNMIQLSVLHTFKNLFQCFSKYSPWAPELAFCDAYKNSQSHWVSLPTRTFITSMHAWLGADDLESPDSSPVSPALLFVHFSRGIVHTAPSSQEPNKLLPYLYSLGTLCRPSDYSFVLQMFAVDLLDNVLFIFSPGWLYNFSISTLGDV